MVTNLPSGTIRGLCSRSGTGDQNKAKGANEMSGLWEASLGAMGRGLDRGEFSAAELVADALARIADINPSVNAFVYLDEEAALTAARESDSRRRAGTSLGPLDGIPVGVKDNLYVEGMPASWGSRRWHGFVPDRNDICVERLVRCGAVLLGKTNTPELAMSSHTDNEVYGVTRNPYDLSLTPGGSSGGSAAAVASNMVPYALGTDAGGSMRAPASLTGLYGLRPTNGRIPRSWGFPPLGFDFQTIGLLTRSMEDLELVYSAIFGADYRDPSSFLVPVDSPKPALRIGWMTRVDDELVDAIVVDRVTEAARLLGDGGFAIAPISSPYDLQRVRAIWGILTTVGVASAIQAAPHPDKELTARVAAMAEAGSGLDAKAYCQAMVDLFELRRNISVAWGDSDVILLPTTPTAAWDARTPSPPTIAGAPAPANAIGMYTTWVNAAGYPALNVPVDAYPDGRPIGVQLVARPGQESSLFAVAAAMESLRSGGSTG